MDGSGGAAIVLLVLCGLAVFAAVWQLIFLVLQKTAVEQGKQRLRETQGARVSGVRALLPAARWVLGRSSRIQDQASRVVVALQARGIVFDQAAALSYVAGAGLVCGLVVLVLVQSLLAGALAGAGVAAVLWWAALARYRKDIEQMREQVPEMLAVLRRTMQAGMTMQQAFAQIAEDAGGRLGAIFQSASHMLETGSDVSEVLRYVQQTCDIDELTFLVAALDIQHRTGGSMLPLVDATQSAVRARLDLTRSLRVQTSQARLSVKVVAALPFVLALVLSAISPGFMQPLFSSPAGLALLGLALLLQGGGIALVRRILYEAQ